MISNCGQDEKGKITGGKAGDQTKKEWALIAWYSRPWKCVLRHPNKEVRKLLAEIATAAAKNNKVGYDQKQRHTFWEQLEANNYDPAKITVKCEADCSSGVAAMVKAVGFKLGIKKLQQVSIYCYTGNLRAALKTAGFEVLTDNKYLTSDAYLQKGDVLLNDGVHTAINVTKGTKTSEKTENTEKSKTTSNNNIKVDAAHSRDNNLKGTYKVTASSLNLRAGAGTDKKSLAVMPQGSKVQCYGYYTSVSGTKWLYVTYNGITGFASSKYLDK